jgi:hypothetical protein
VHQLLRCVVASSLVCSEFCNETRNGEEWERKKERNIEKASENEEIEKKKMKVENGRKKMWKLEQREK